MTTIIGTALIVFFLQSLNSICVNDFKTSYFKEKLKNRMSKEEYEKYINPVDKISNVFQIFKLK